MYVRFERADELLRQPSCLRVDFGRNALSRSYLLSSIRARRIPARLAFFSTSGARQYVSFRVRHVQRGLLFFRPHGRGNTFRFVQDAFSEACFLFDLNDEAIRSFPFLFSLTDYPGEGPPYQLRSSRVSVLVFSVDGNNSFHLFPPASALQSTRVRGRFISIRGIHRSLTQAGESDSARNERASWGQHCDERDVEQRFLCDFTSPWEIIPDPRSVVYD